MFGKLSMGTKVKFLICRHGQVDQGRGLSDLGKKQVEKLRDDLKGYFKGPGSFAGLLCSQRPWALETADILKADGGFMSDLKVQTDSDLNDCVFDEDEEEYHFYMRVQRFFRNNVADHWGKGQADTGERFVVIVTHSSWIDACARLHGTKKWDEEFSPVPEGTVRCFDFPCGKWVCETAKDYRDMMLSEKKKLMADVLTKWLDKSAGMWGESSVEWVSKDWEVKTDVWKMKVWSKQSGGDLLRVDMMPLMAITTDIYLTCIRDLKASDLPSLQELDERFPDEDGWVKYIMYPPFVWRLHVHIQKTGTPIPFFNVYMLKDVINMVNAKESLTMGSPFWVHVHSSV
jgi:broad specificity phosphatase PhoE